MGIFTSVQNLAGIGQGGNLSPQPAPFPGSVQPNWSKGSLVFAGGTPNFDGHTGQVNGPQTFGNPATMVAGGTPNFNPSTGQVNGPVNFGNSPSNSFGAAPQPGTMFAGGTPNFNSNTGQVNGPQLFNGGSTNSFNGGGAQPPFNDLPLPQGPNPTETTPNYAKASSLGSNPFQRMLSPQNPNLDIDTNYYNSGKGSSVFGQNRTNQDDGMVDRLNAAVQSGQMTQDQANSQWSKYRESQKEYQRGLDTARRKANQHSLTMGLGVAAAPFLGAGAGFFGVGSAGAESTIGTTALASSPEMGGALGGLTEAGMSSPELEAAAGGADGASGAIGAAPAGNPLSSIGDISRLIGGVGGFLGGRLANSRNTGAAGAASNASNPLTQPQRQPYQDQLSNLMTPGGATQFMNSDPQIQAEKDLIAQWVNANFAKSGNMPLSSITGSAQLASVLGQQYNQRIGDLSTLGGFNQGNPYGGQPFTSAMGLNNANTGVQLAGLGSALQTIMPYLSGLFTKNSGATSGEAGELADLV